MNVKTVFLLALCFFNLVIAFADISVVDDYGKAVILNHPAARIISLSPSITETLFSIGAGENIIGTVEQSDYPAAAKKIKRIGQYPDPDLELMVHLNPDLIVMPFRGNSYPLYEKLKKLNFPVYVFSPQKIKNIASEMIKLGMLTGKEKISQQKADDFLRQLNQTKKNKKAISVFYELWDVPLMTIGGNTMIGEVIQLCGGKNIFNDEKISYFRISKVSVIQKNPEVIFVSKKQMLEDWASWNEISAIKNKHLYYIDPDEIQHDSPRILDGIAKICEALYPE